MLNLDKRIEELVVAGEAALARGENREAAKYLQEALNASSFVPDTECRLRCLLSKALEGTHRYNEALEVIRVYESEESRQRLSPQARGEAALRLGWIYSLTGDPPRAIALLNQALKEFKEVGYEAGIGEAYHALGRTYIVEVEEYKIAHDHFEEALDYQRRSGDTHALAQTYLRLGLIDYQEGDISTAKKHFTEAVRLAEGSTDYTLLGALYINIATIYFEQCETEEAARYFQMAIEHLERVGHKRLLGVACASYGRSLMRSGDWAEATEMLERALELTREAGSMRDEAVALQTLGSLQYQQGDLNRAEVNLQASVSMLARLNNRSGLVESYRYLALTAAARNRYDEAFDFAKRALQLTFTSRNSRLAAGSYLVLAEMHMRRKEFRTAEDFLKMARAKLDQQVDLELSGIAQRVLGKMKMVQNDLPAARSALAQSISYLRTAKSEYHLALAELEMGTLLLRLGDKAQARDNLQRSARAFAVLGLQKLGERAEELLAQLPVEKEAQPPIAVGFDSSLVERVIEASHQRELLLRELISIASDLLRTRLVIIFELNEVGDAVPALTQGEQVQNMARLCERVRLQMAGGLVLPPESVLLKLHDRFHKDMLLYAVAASKPDSEQVRHLKALVRMTEQGLEVCSLRERMRKVRDFDPSQMRFLASMPGFLVVSPAMKTVLEQIQKIRSSTVTVLITGESGTGKELIARAIHLESERRDRDFLPFNCAAVAKEIVESRLFGHRKGAFTGASQDQRGIIRAAEGGTIFLDEVGELPLDIQPKLLRFLQEGEIHALGDDRPVRVDVRVLAATNRDLEAFVRKGLFREDLFHRLNVIRIHIPPLRDRKEEILPLAESFLKTFSEQSGKQVALSEAVAERLLAYNWPGNIRQLKNEIERIVAYAENTHVVTLHDLSPEIVSFRGANTAVEAAQAGSRINIPSSLTLAEAVDALERQMVMEALKKNNGNISRTARQLGLTRKGLQLKRSRLGV